MLPQGRMNTQSGTCVCITLLGFRRLEYVFVVTLLNVIANHAMRRHLGQRRRKSGSTKIWYLGDNQEEPIRRLPPPPPFPRMQARAMDARPRPITVPARGATSSTPRPSSESIAHMQREEFDDKIFDASAANINGARASPRRWSDSLTPELCASKAPHNVALRMNTNEGLGDVNTGLSAFLAPADELGLGRKSCNDLPHQRTVKPRQHYQGVFTGGLNATVTGTTKAAQAVRRVTGHIRRTGAGVAGRGLKAVHEESHKVRPKHFLDSSAMTRRYQMNTVPAGFQGFHSKCSAHGMSTGGFLS